MNILRSLTIGTLIFGMSIPSLAAEETAIGTDEERAACAHSLGLSPALAETGSYKIRIDNCIHERWQALQTIERTNRLQLRAESVLDRITRNSRSYIHRPIAEAQTPAERFDRFQQLYDADSTYRLLERNKPSLRENAYERAVERSVGYTPYRPEASQPRNDRQIDTARPSRRMIKQDAYDQTRESRIQSADVYQSQLHDALNACEHIENSFHRNNCVRSELRKVGSQ